MTETGPPKVVSPYERRLHVITVALLTLLLGACVYQSSRDHWETHPIRVERASRETTDLRVDLNRADAATLEHLPGIGKKRARDIVAHREAHGPFRTVEDVKQIAGIKEATFQMMAPYIRTAPADAGDGVPERGGGAAGALDAGPDPAPKAASGGVLRKKRSRPK